MAKKRQTRRARRGRGEGGIRELADGRWEGSLSLGVDPATGRRRRKTVSAATKKEVVDLLADLRNETPQAGRAELARQTVPEFLRSWLRVAGRDWAPGTRREHTRHVELHLAPRLDGMRLERLDRLAVERLVTGLLNDGVGRATVGKVLANTLRPALAWGVGNGLLAVNAAAGVKAPKHAAPEKIALDADQLGFFLQAVAGDALAPLWLFSADTGCRQGEAFALTWSGLDLEAGQVRFTQSLEELDGQQRLKELKTKGSRRTVKLAAATVAALRGHRRRQAAAGLVGADLPVFTDSAGGWLRKSNVGRRSFAPAVAKANELEAAAARKAKRLPRPIPAGFTVHGLRHTCATLLLANGVDVVTVSKRLGHAKPSTTLNFYAHALHDSQDRAAAVLEGILGPIGGGMAAESGRDKKKKKSQVEDE